MRRFLLLAVLLIGCSAESPQTATDAPAPQTQPPPTAEEARARIADSAELGEFDFTGAAWTSPVQSSSMSAPVREEARQLAATGWITLDESGNILLSERAQSDRRFLLRANGILDVVPIAKKEMGDVTAVRTNPDGTVAVDFTWRWIPNEVGEAFRSGPVHDRMNATHAATATLMWNGTEWVILKIDRRPAA